LLSQVVAQPIGLDFASFQGFVETMPLTAEVLGEAEEWEGRKRTCQTEGIQRFAQGVTLLAESMGVNRLTKFDDPVKVLLGRLFFVHTSSFYPRAVSRKGTALLFV
jgi:hypothetical protein